MVATGTPRTTSSGPSPDPLPRSDPPRSDPPRSDPPRSDPPRSDRPRSDPARIDPRQFVVTPRGYDRAQVDHAVGRLVAEVMALRRRLTGSEVGRARAERHAVASEAELREARERPAVVVAAASDGFGLRAERLLRLAEREAADVRATVGRETTAYVERTRADLERHRRDIERDLVARSGQLEQAVARATAEREASELEAAELLGSARADAERIRRAADDAAQEQLRRATTAAEELSRRTTDDVTRSREHAGQEIERLAGLQDVARADLTRLLFLLTGGLVDPEDPVAAEPDRTDPAGAEPDSLESDGAAAGTTGSGATDSDDRVTGRPGQAGGTSRPRSTVSA